MLSLPLCLSCLFSVAVLTLEACCYVHGTGGIAYCLDAKTGEMLWTAWISKRASNEFNIQHPET